MNSINLSLLNENKRSRIIFLGRLSEQKNIDALIEINQQLKLIDFYGKANDDYSNSRMQQLITDGFYKGSIDGEEALISVLSKYKFMILYSKYEGFPFSLVESLSQGLPIIVKDSFLSASYLCNKKTGLLLPLNTSINEDIETIKKFISMSDEQYHQYQINCVNFYNENLNIDIFAKKWMKIFDQYLARKK